MRVRLIDPSGYTPPYDHALCAALARAGLDVTLATSPAALDWDAGLAAAETVQQRADAEGPVPLAGPGGHGSFRVEPVFYRRAARRPPSRARLAAKLAQHVPGMLAEARRADARADIAHYQWLPVQHVDGLLLPRRTPTVLTAHDVLPREPRRGQLAAQKRLYERVDAVVVHSQHGRGRLLDEAGTDPEKVHVIPHGAFTHLVRPGTLPPELRETDPTARVVLFFGLLRPYKGLDVLLDAWRQLAPAGAELWIVGRPRGVAVPELPPAARLVDRFVDGDELAGIFQRATLAVLPYREIDQSGVLFTALAFGLPLLLSDAGGFPELEPTGAAWIVPRGDTGALASALFDLLDPAGGDALATMAAAAREAAVGPYSWDAIARQTVVLYSALAGVA